MTCARGRIRPDENYRNERASFKFSIRGFAEKKIEIENRRMTKGSFNLGVVCGILLVFVVSAYFTMINQESFLRSPEYVQKRKSSGEIFLHIISCIIFPKNHF